MLPLLAALLLAQAHVHPAAGDANNAVPEHQHHPFDKDAPPPQGSTIELKAGTETSRAYVANPKGRIRGAVLVIHEWWGLNDWVKHMADELAEEGYLALAIDLYRGKVATDPAQAAELMKGKDEAYGDKVEEAGLEWLKANGEGAKVATIGWCMGGGESLKASLNDPGDVDATVMYYGMPVDDVAKLKTLRGPLLGIFARKDGWITPAKVAAFGEALTKANVRHQIREFDADHAFANPSGGKYNPHAAREAWQLTRRFLAANLKGK